MSTTTTTVAMEQEQPTRIARIVGPLRSQRRIAMLVELLALVPFVAILVEVVRAPRLQFLDYWYTLVRFTNPDGSMDPSRLLNLSNEHLVALPSLLYWGNAQLFAGDNRTLGVVVVLIGGLTVLALRSALPKSLPPLMRASLVVAASGLVFSLHGLWNYARSMSGAAWLTANLIVVITLLLAVRGRWWAAWLIALIGSVTYGTAFAVWPALALVAIMRREPKWRWALPLVAGGAIAVVWLILRPSAPPGWEPASDIGTVVYNFLVVVGHMWTSDNGGIAAIAGAAMLGLYAALSTTRVAREPQLRFWWALACYAFFGCGMIAAARIDFGAEFGLLGRYSSLSALMSIPLIVMLVLVAHRSIPRQAPRVAMATVLVGALAFVLGSPAAAKERDEQVNQALQAIAMRGGFSDTFPWLPRSGPLIPRLEGIGHYPFTDDFTLGCGGPELGDRLDLKAMQPLGNAVGYSAPREPVGWVDHVEERHLASRIRGWATGVRDPIRCTVIVDGTGTIVGGGLSGLGRRDVAAGFAGQSPSVGFEVMGPVQEKSRIVFIQHSGAMRWLPAEVSQP